MTHIILFVLIVYVSTCIAKELIHIPNVSQQDDGCLCKEYSCGCCVTIDIPEICLNDTGCLNIAYLPKEYGISLTLIIDNTVLINETISERNPPPLCMEPPFMDEYIHICIRFYDMDITSAKFHGCVKLEIKMLYVFSLKEWDLGCFNLDMPSYKHSKNLYELLQINNSNISKPSLDYDVKENGVKTIFPCNEGSLPPCTGTLLFWMIFVIPVYWFLIFLP